MNWNTYYEIKDSSIVDGLHSFEIRIKSDCDVYRGHFPGHPISPGVCNIGMIRDLTEKVLQKKLRFSSIKQCRLTGMITPINTPELTVLIYIATSEGGCSIKAEIKDSEKSYLELKADAIYF
ncbi:MAG: beta-hydroxyacyl-ACP dehydratase [Alistipes sp.]|nr:beta-hydroxyacyl-ACP dehydratase [Candidatus Minthomonas equi]